MMAQNKDSPSIFIAGASGMVGRALIRHIQSFHPSATCVAGFFSQQPINFGSGVKSVVGDCRKAEDCLRISAGCNMAVLAAASTGGILQSVSEPWLQVNDNLIMNALLLEALAKNGVKRIVMIGSATCYQPVSGAVTEEGLNWSQDPHPSYLGIGWVSRYLEKLCQFWHEKAGLEIIFLRAANIYGPFARFNPKTSNFIPALIRKVADRPSTLKVLGNPKVLRDVIYVDDFAKACTDLLFAKDIAFDIFNVGTSVPCSVRNVVEILLDISNQQDLKVDYESSSPATVGARILDCQKLQKAIGWSPDFSTRAGIEATFNWWLENQNTWKR
jgi:nucleoside-diphosphate-sugar epimerase